MILCPNCLNKEMPGALFCSECGSQIANDSNATTSAIRETSPGDDSLPFEQSAFAPAQNQEPSGDTILSLNLLSSGVFINLEEYRVYTLGRISKGHPLVPDIDLTPYKAYEAGVSRTHLSIEINENAIAAMDLGSVNGTRINDKKISSHTPHPIRNGDILTLGKLKIQILTRNK